MRVTITRRTAIGALLAGAVGAQYRHGDNRRTRVSTKKRLLWHLEGHPAPSLNQSSDGTVYFDFPTDSATVNYMLYQGIRSAVTASQIQAEFSIVTTGNPVFNYVFEAGNTCVFPAHARFYFERVGWETGGEFYRWWSNPISYELAAGSTTLIAPLTLPDQWSSVFGRFGNDYPQEFRDALADIQNIGFSFGGGCFFGHGVNVSGGTAQFRLSSFIVQ